MTFQPKSVLISSSQKLVGGLGHLMNPPLKKMAKYKPASSIINKQTIRFEWMRQSENRIAMIESLNEYKALKCY